MDNLTFLEEDSMVRQKAQQALDNLWNIEEEELKDRLNPDQSWEARWDRSCDRNDRRGDEMEVILDFLVGKGIEFETSDAFFFPMEMNNLRTNLRTIEDVVISFSNGTRMFTWGLNVCERF